MKTIIHILTSIHTMEQFEELKQTATIFEEAVKLILNRHHLPLKSLSIFSEGTNIVFSYDNRKVIKLFPPFHQEHFKSEGLVLKALEGKLSVKTPELYYEGEIAGWPYLIMSQLVGTLLEKLWDGLDHQNKLIIVKELGSLIKEVHSLPTEGLEAIDCHWNRFIEKQIAACVAHHHTKKLNPDLIQQIPSYMEHVKHSLFNIEKPVILTGEYTPMNFLVRNIGGIWHIGGLIDFGDAMLGHYKYDLLGPGAFLIQGDKELLKAFLEAYGFLPNELHETLSRELTALMLLHQYSNLNVQVRIRGWENKVSALEELEKLVWGF